MHVVSFVWCVAAARRRVGVGGQGARVAARGVLSGTRCQLRVDPFVSFDALRRDALCAAIPGGSRGFDACSRVIGSAARFGCSHPGAPPEKFAWWRAVARRALPAGWVAEAPRSGRSSSQGWSDSHPHTFSATRNPAGITPGCPTTTDRSRNAAGATRALRLYLQEHEIAAE